MSHIEKIRAYIANELAPDAEIEDLPIDYEIITSGLVDSLSLVRLVVWIESEFSISLGDMDISPSDLGSIQNVNQLINRAAQAATV